MSIHILTIISLSPNSHVYSALALKSILPIFAIWSDIVSEIISRYWAAIHLFGQSNPLPCATDRLKISISYTPWGGALNTLFVSIAR